MVSKNECYTYFYITGSFEPEEVTALLGLQPFRTWKAGEKRRDGTVFDCSAWETEHCSKYDWDTDRQMRQTLEPLMEKRALLKKFREEHEVSMYLEIVPTIFPNQPAPALAPSLEVMKFCVETGTEIDIDLYL